MAIDDILKPREKEIIRLICLGYSRKEIAEMLKIANSTIKTHIMHIMNKFNISDYEHGNQSAKYLRMALVYLKEHKELLNEEREDIKY